MVLNPFSRANIMMARGFGTAWLEKEVRVTGI